jgi:hypothetical protein
MGCAFKAAQVLVDQTGVNPVAVIHAQRNLSEREGFESAGGIGVIAMPCILKLASLSSSVEPVRGHGLHANFFRVGFGLFSDPGLDRVGTNILI